MSLRGNQSDANLENIFYLHDGHLDTNKLFLVSLVGSEYLQVFGAVRLKQDGSTQFKSIITPICNPVSLQYLSPHSDRVLEVVPNLAGVLYALQKGLLEQLQVEGEAKSLLPLLPAVSCSCCNMNITYESRIKPDKLLFIGNWNCQSNSHRVIVKFVQGKYGENAHRIVHLLNTNLHQT